MNGGVTIHFIYDTQYRVIEERDNTEAVVATYTYGQAMDEPLTMERGGQTYYYHRDALGSITEVSDSTGVIVERYEYDVYGEFTIYDVSDTEIAASAIGNPYLFTGRHYDAESDNYYYRARYYSHKMGRFLSPDPLGFDAGDYNLYRYVFNNPANMVDPTGQCIGVLGGADTVLCVMIVGAVIGAAIDLGVQLIDIYLDRGTLKGLDVRNDIDWISIGISAAAGAASGGLGAGLSAFKSAIIRLGLNAVGSAGIGGIATYAEKYFKGEWECDPLGDKADVIISGLVSGSLGFIGGVGDELFAAISRSVKKHAIKTGAQAYHDASPGLKNIIDTTSPINPFNTPLDISHVIKNIGVAVGLTISGSGPITE